MIKKIVTKQRIGWLLFYAVGLFFMMVLFFTVDLMAASSGSILFHCVAPDVRFTLYRVGSIDSLGEVKPVVALEKVTTDLDWNSTSAPGAVASYVERGGLSPYRQGRTDENSEVVFEKMPEGVYLALCSEVEIKGKRSVSSPVLVRIPDSIDQDMNVVVNHTKHSLLSKKPEPSNKQKYTKEKNRKEKNTSNTKIGLPKTGQLWWPVLVLSCLGFSFLRIGLKYRQK